MRSFVDALKPSIQLELLQAKPRTLEEAMALGNEIEECIEGTKKNYHHENNLMKKVNFVRTQIPKAPGAKYWNKRDPNNKFKSKIGNMSPNKPNKFKNNNFVRKFERPAYNNKNEGNTKITCYNCKGNH